MPEWWEEQWARCLVDGTLKYGWGNVPSGYAVECGFTFTYKGLKKQRKPTKKELEQQQQLKAIESQMNGVQIASPNGDAKSSMNPTPSPPQMIVKKREWLAEGKKQEGILASICNHFRKEIATTLREAKAQLKTANKQRKLGTSASQNVKAKEDKERKEREKKEKKERKREKKEKKRREKEKRRKAREEAAAQPVDAAFEAANSITAYFSSALKNMPAGTKNAFDVLGKHKASPKKDKKHKDKKSKYTKTKLVVTFDEAGNFKVPIKISKGKMVKNLGVISDDPAYHGTSTIYPVGYKCCIASLPSFKRPGKTATFTTEILRGETGPLFVVSCSDDPEFKMSAKNPSKVWGELKAKWQDQADEKAGKPLSPPSPKKTKASGPQKIGLTHPDIKRIIECMPGALKCGNYKFKYRQDSDDSLSPKKAFKKTLKIKKEKTPKKKKKPQPPQEGAESNSNSLAQGAKDNVIVIEDSPSASVPAPAPAHPTAREDEDAAKLKKTRKRKHPSDGCEDAGLDAGDAQPKKKRKIDEKLC